MLTLNSKALKIGNKWLIPINGLGPTPQPTIYHVTTSGSHGSVVASPTEGTTGTEVTLSNTPDTHYHFDSYTITGATLKNANQFDIANSDVTVVGNFVQSVSYDSYWIDIVTGSTQAGQIFTNNGKIDGVQASNALAGYGVDPWGNTQQIPANGLKFGSPNSWEGCIADYAIKFYFQLDVSHISSNVTFYLGNCPGTSITVRLYGKIGSTEYTLATATNVSPQSNVTLTL